VVRVGTAVTRRRCTALALGVVSITLGCGRKATAADCQLIVDKSVELQMKADSETDPAAIKEREKRIRGALEDEIKACETRRVTEKTMACVQAAASTQELQQCLR
jgi:hypothetical protein